MDDPASESLFVPVAGDHELHLERFHRSDAAGTPVLMLHGSIENGRIFYPGRGGGFAPYLARQGFDVYVGDLRGRGASRPPIDRNSSFGQTEAITEDIAAFSDEIALRRAGRRQVWVAHSWGGVLLLAHLARFPGRCALVERLVLFATKRTIRVRTLQRFLAMDILWCLLGSALIAVCGYLPARRVRRGLDSETARSHAECTAWVRQAEWIDPRDGFPYGREIQGAALPPILFLAGAGDRALGHPADVERFREEVAPGAELWVVGRDQGFRHDYGHVSLLVHPDAVRDHFPAVLRWIG